MNIVVVGFKINNPSFLPEWLRRTAKLGPQNATNAPLSWMAEQKNTLFKYHLKTLLESCQSEILTLNYLDKNIDSLAFWEHL